MHFPQGINDLSPAGKLFLIIPLPESSGPAQELKCNPSSKIIPYESLTKSLNSFMPAEGEGATICQI
jgi:hypothetical protein